MKEERRRHVVQALRLRRRAAMATARLYARELRIERLDGHDRRSAIDENYRELIAAYREDARDCLRNLRKLFDR